MKQFLVIASLFTASLLVAQPPKGDAKKGMTFGTSFKAKGAIDANKLEESLQDSNKKEVKVKGVVSQVCTAEGCWLKLKTDNKDIMVKMKDHKFLVPLAMNGKTIVVNGTAQKKITTVEQLKHYAEDAGKSKAEIEAITEGKEEVIIQATGIVVMK